MATIAGSDDGGPRTYPGGKNGSGIFQRIISNMPPHEIYIEPFLGSGAVMRRKRPARSRNVGIDVDAGIIARHGVAGDRERELICADAVQWLKSHFAIFTRWHRRTLVYCDPPYLGSARSRPGRPCYSHEMLAGPEHAELLHILTTIPAMVMISGYPAPLYDDLLKDWRRIDYQAQTRGGLKAEVLWMNYPPPSELHDYRFLGRDFHDRCRINRKITRWARRLAALPTLERAAIIAALGVGAGR